MEQIAHLTQLRETLLAPAPLEEKLQHITDNIIPIFNVDIVRIWIACSGNLCDKTKAHTFSKIRVGKTCLYLKASSRRGAVLERQDHGQILLPDDVLEAILTGMTQKFVVNHTASNPQRYDTEWAKLGLIAFAGYRLLAADGHVMGMITLASQRPIARKDDALLEGLAHTTAHIIQTASTGAALRESEARFRNLIDSIDDIVFMLNDKQQHVGVYGRWLDNLGMTPADFLGKTAREIMGPEAAQPHESANARALTGENVVYEWSTPQTEGTVHYQTSLSPLRNDAGQITGLVGIGRDITALKHAEQALLESEARLKHIIQQMPYPVEVCTPDGTAVLVNQAFLDMFCIPSADLIVNKYNVFDDPALQALSLMDEIRQVYAGESRFLPEVIFPLEAIAPDFHATGAGNIIQEITMFPVISPQGDIAQVVTIWKDITENHRSQALLRAQRDLGLKLNAAQGLSETLPICLDMALRISGMDSGGIYLIDQASGDLNLAYHKGLPPAFVAHARHYAADSAQVHLVSARQPLYTHYTDLKVPQHEVRRSEGLRALGILPIAHQTRVIGCLNIASHTQDDIPGFARTALETLVTQMGNAIVRAQVESALQQSQENFQTLFNSLEDFLFVLDMEGNILHINSVVARRLGYTETELQGQSVLLVHPPAQRREAGAIVSNMIAGKTDSCNIPVQSKAGTLIPVETHITQGHWNDQPALFGIARDITERISAEQEIRQRTAQLETLRQVELELTGQLDLDVLLSSIVQRAIDLLDANEGGLYLYHAEQDVLECVVATESNITAPGNILRRGEKFAGKVWETGQPLLVNDYQPWAKTPSASGETSLIAVIGVPIYWGQTLTGVLNVNASAPRTFSEDDVQLLSLFAPQVAIAIRNAHLLQAEHEQRMLAESLVEAAAAITTPLDTEQVLDRILDQVGRVVTADACNIMLVEGDNVARIVRWREYTHSYHDLTQTSFHIDQYPPLLTMTQTAEPLLISNISQCMHWKSHEELAWQRSYVGAPVMMGKMIVGFLNVDSAKTDAFSAADAQRLKAFATQAAIGIEHAQLYRELRDYADLLEIRVNERTSELEAQYARLDAILHSAADGIVLVDCDGHIQHANPLAHMWLEQSLSSNDSQELHTAIQTLARQTCTGSDEKPPVSSLLALKGLDLELRAAPVLETDKAHITAVVVDIHDISHLKALERMKTRFVTDISHELRTPITAIQLYAHLMQQRPEKSSDYLEKLIQQADWQAQLVQDIQEIAHLDAGRVEMHPQATALNTLTEAIVSKHQQLSHKKELTLTHIPCDPSPVALVDAQRLEQALDNILGNAIHYTPAGGQVTLRLQTEEIEGRRWAKIIATDTGIGIPKDELPHIFKRFFRGRQAQLMQPGTGLGLAIVKEILELHGGRVTVQSSVDAQRGSGTRFTLWLPHLTTST